MTTFVNWNNKKKKSVNIKSLICQSQREGIKTQKKKQKTKSWEQPKSENKDVKQEERE